jgi:hypothetical protein
VGNTVPGRMVQAEKRLDELSAATIEEADWDWGENGESFVRSRECGASST